jgi:hypothetical protein
MSCTRALHLRLDLPQRSLVPPPPLLRRLGVLRTAHYVLAEGGKARAVAMAAGTRGDRHVSNDKEPVCVYVCVCVCVYLGVQAAVERLLGGVALAKELADGLLPVARLQLRDERVAVGAVQVRRQRRMHGRF